MDKCCSWMAVAHEGHLSIDEFCPWITLTIDYIQYIRSLLHMFFILELNPTNEGKIEMSHGLGTHLTIYIYRNC